MKYLNKFWIGAIITLLASCVDNGRFEFDVEKPESLAKMEYLNDYDVLKSYIDRTANPNFKLGAGVSVGDFNKLGLSYSHIVSNFDEMTAGWEMKHGGVVQADGSLSTSNVEKFITNAQLAGITIYGHTLCWHANQNAEYLNSRIAPTVIPGTGEPTWKPVTEIDFETDDASKYLGNAGAAMSFTADGGGKDGKGRALIITNSGGHVNDWDCQFFVLIDPAAQEGDQYELTMDIKANVPFNIPTQAHHVPYAYSHWDFFGAIPATTEWSTYRRQITVTADQAKNGGAGAIAFNLGVNANVFYLDNISVKKYIKTGGGQIIEKTPEEKRNILTAELERWIAGMMKVSKAYVKAWDVVNEPMDDGKPFELKTGVGKKLAADEFYWQDYIGKDYAVTAFKLAAQYGNSNDKLFINDYNLEYNLDKCRGLIAYVEYIESKGARVDGIGTQMHIDIYSDKEKITQMFQLLARTGKLIKISELDIGIGKKTTEATDDDYQAQAEMYRFVVEKYFELIPATQRYGITVWSPLDSPNSSSWRAGEPVGLWTESYKRKPAYAGFADGLIVK